MKALSKKEQTQLEELRGKLENAALEYNSAREALAEFCADVKDRIDTFIGDKSDAWQESDKGAAYQSWADAFDEIPDECDETIPEYPIEPEI